MNREDILEIVREAYERGQSDLMESCKEASVKAIELAVLAERDACAKVCERYWSSSLGSHGTAIAIAAAIRARNNT